MNLGMARYMAGHPAEAVAPLRKAVQLSPGLAPASLFLGASLLDLGRPQEAVPSLQKAVTAMPDNADAREMLARGQLMLSRFSSAAASYRILSELQPQNPKSGYGIAKCYEGLTEELLAALQRQAPDSPVLELLVADLAVTQEKYAAALAIYRRVMAHPPVGGLHEAVADLYERAGKNEWAIAERRKPEPRSPGGCAARPGECEFLRGRFREALAAGTRAATPSGRYWAIRAANRLATDAVAHLETLPPSIGLHLIKAEIAQSRRDYPDAVTEVRAALALAPGDPAIETALAEALLHAHDLKEAIGLLDRLNRNTPGDASLLLILGDALVEDQQSDRAIPFLEQAVKASAARRRRRPCWLAAPTFRRGATRSRCRFFRPPPQPTRTVTCTISLRAPTRPCSARRMPRGRWPYTSESRRSRRSPRPRPRRNRHSRRRNNASDARVRPRGRAQVAPRRLGFVRDGHRSFGSVTVRI